MDENLSYHPLTTPCEAIPLQIQDGGDVVSTGDLRESCGLPAEAHAVAVTIAAQGDTTAHLVPGSAGTFPIVSILNFPAGDWRASNGILELAQDGTISLTSPLPCSVALSVSGYFAAAGLEGGKRYVPITPVRILLEEGRVINAQTEYAFRAQGTKTIPPNGIAAIAFNVVVHGERRTPWPGALRICGAGNATAASCPPVVHFPQDSTVPNGGILTLLDPVGESPHDYRVYATSRDQENKTGPLYVYIDTSGYFVDAAQEGLGYYPIPPCRRFQGPIPGDRKLTLKGTEGTGSQCTQASAIPNEARAVAAHVAISYGYVSNAWAHLDLRPTGVEETGTSLLNFPSGPAIVGNGVIITLGDEDAGEVEVATGISAE